MPDLPQIRVVHDDNEWKAEPQQEEAVEQDPEEGKEEEGMPELEPANITQILETSKLMPQEELAERMENIHIEAEGLFPQPEGGEITEEMKNNLLWRKSSDVYGSTWKKAKLEASKHGLNGRFTDHLVMAGMYRNQSLTTTPDKSRFVQGAQDWMLKLD